MFLSFGFGVDAENGRAQPIKAGLLGMSFLLTLFGLVFFDSLPQPHLILSLFPARRIL
jgi:hypothetical protein